MVTRRTFLRSAGPATGFAIMAPGLAAAVGPVRDRFDVPHRGYPPPHSQLRHGSPESAGLDPAVLQDLRAQLLEWTRPKPATRHPMYPGAVLLLANHGTVVARTAIGTAYKYADVRGTPLPPDEQIPMRADTIFDLASLSKLFTTLVALHLMGRGAIELYAPVAKYVPGFATNGKSAVTVQQLLTHTSGFDADPKPLLWQGYDTIPERIEAVIEAPLINPPGSTYLYSDLNMLNLQQVVEHVTGDPLDALVAKVVTRPLGMHDTMYNPPAHLQHRIAPTEYQVGPGSSGRGLVWGQVHDENAWSLGGVAGHAGVFSTVDDMATLGQGLLNGGSYRGHRILSQRWVDTIFTNYNQRFPGQAHGLGFELDQMWYMGGLAGIRTAGHTGFTGTSIVYDTTSRSLAVLLTNRVHPSRDWGSNNRSREASATALARAQSVQAPTGASSDYAPLGNRSTAVLTTRGLHVGGKPASLAFDTFVDTESTDPLVVESTTDGTRWAALPLTVTGPGAPGKTVRGLSGHGHRIWWHVTAALPAGVTALRWRYTTDTHYTGRGVNVAGVLIRRHGTVLLDGDAHPGALRRDGWRRSAR